MKKILSAVVICVLSLAVLSGCKHTAPKNTDTLVILHTNDTHSHINPEEAGGGALRRMAAIDSIRSKYSNVLLLDAGDAVQGSLYFYLYGGRVEQEVLNIMGVDAGILGNHEFDNGMDSLAMMMSLRNSPLISSNYDMSATPLDGVFVPYVLKEYGAKKIAILGINLDPDGILAAGTYDGLKFLPIIATANALADSLKMEAGVDGVIALTHIGYDPVGLVGDSLLAANSRNIDIIIGGHSHDLIDPSTPAGASRSRVRNLAGREVLVTQTGRYGMNLGKIEIPIDSIGTGRPDYEIIPIDHRFDRYRNAALENLLAPYQRGLDSLMTLWVARTERPLPMRGDEMLNFFSDYVLLRGREIAPNVDLGITNLGSLRTDLPEGPISKGHILNLIPFKNHITVVDMKGSDLIDVFKVMAGTGGNGVSANVRGSYRTENGDSHYVGATIDGAPIDPNRIYRVATNDYLARGGDYMSGFLNSTTVAVSPEVLYDDMLEYFSRFPDNSGVFGGSAEPRWTQVQ